jgi:hypothetical protein
MSDNELQDNTLLALTGTKKNDPFYRWLAPTDPASKSTPFSSWCHRFKLRPARLQITNQNGPVPEEGSTQFGCRSHCRYRVAAFSATEPMFVIAEPESCYTERLRTPRPVPSIVAAAPTTPPKPIVPSRLPSDDFWTEVVFEILKTSGDEPMRITSIVNESLKWDKFARRADRVEHKKKMFRVVGRLIRTCRLDRYNREFVTVPTSDVRRQVYLAKATLTVELPHPCV